MKKLLPALTAVKNRPMEKNQSYLFLVVWQTKMGNSMRLAGIENKEVPLVQFDW
jgi:hypothetical protein